MHLPAHQLVYIADVGPYFDIYQKYYIFTLHNRYSRRFINLLRPFIIWVSTIAYLMFGRILFMNIELWKPVLGYENYYLVSNFGRIKSLDRIMKWRHFDKIKKGRLLSPKPSKYGYIRVVLTNENGTEKSHPLHRLIAQVFIPNPENKLFINHINGIKNDNTIQNLEWCTIQENTIHAFKTGLRTGIGEVGKRSKLNKELVLEIRELYDQIRSPLIIAKKYGISEGSAYLIGKRISWKHI
jgi:hypothetical protein